MTNCNDKTNMSNTHSTAIIRISIGHYPEEKEALVEHKLEGVFKEKIKPAVQRMDGNLHYYVTIDRDKNAISNISIWKSEEHAMQMSEMQEMKEMAKEFIDLGVQFSEITNHEIIWQLPED